MTQGQKEIALEILNQRMKTYSGGPYMPVDSTLEAMHAYHTALTPEQGSKEPVFTLQQALDIWDKGYRRAKIEEENETCGWDLLHSCPDKKQYFKTKFQIDI